MCKGGGAELHQCLPQVRHGHHLPLQPGESEGQRPPARGHPLERSETPLDQLPAPSDSSQLHLHLTPKEFSLPNPLHLLALRNM
jgi:hypothetical protein